MAISTLEKYSVIDTANSNVGMVMPKLKYRFRVIFTGFGVSTDITELTRQVSDAARPSVKFEAKTIDVYNSKINYAGKYTWDPIAIKLRDDSSNLINSIVGEQNQKQFDFFEQSSAATAGTYKFNMAIEMLDGGNGANIPVVLERWDCEGCYIVSTNYGGGLTYKDADPMLIELSIQPDNCIQTTDGQSAGLGISGTITRDTTSTLMVGGAVA